MSELIAYKSNSLIEASYKLTLQEQRLLLMCIGRLNPQEDSPRKVFQITAKDFYLEFPAIGLGNAERHLHDAVNKLAERWIYLRRDTEEREIRWIQEKAKYFNGEGKVEIVFSNSIMPYLTQLHDQFTRIVVKNVSSLRSVYSIRIYELLMQFKSIGDRLISVDDFRSILTISSQYPLFKDLNKYVIKPAIKELNEKSNLSVSVEAVKQGRKVVALHFRFKETKSKGDAL